MNEYRGDTAMAQGDVKEFDPELKAFVGTKILLAKPMHELEWNKDKNQECGKRDGYLVVYDNGYRAWSPKDVFETHYRLLTDTEKSIIKI